MTKILIVDDDKEVTSLFGSYLSFEGYEVVSVNQSSKAVQTALESKPDLFILDLMMPEPDGFKVCRTLRKFSAFLDTPILYRHGTEQRRQQGCFIRRRSG